MINREKYFSAKGHSKKYQQKCFLPVILYFVNHKSSKYLIKTEQELLESDNSSK